MQLYKTDQGALLLENNQAFLLTGDWDDLINRKFLFESLLQLSTHSAEVSLDESKKLIDNHLLPPIGSQEVWAAGVTYLKSRDARMEESKDSGAADCYEKVYNAERPELFFKSLPHRVAGPGEEVYIRRDSTWNVPEPELALYLNSEGEIQAYTVGNDMSSRSIEGENPLYLPQAKVYERSAALGPCLFITRQPLPMDTRIDLKILRNDQIQFEASAAINQMKRTLTDLASYLFRECEFHKGCFLMTGTCLVPPDHFTLQVDDMVEITIDPVGTLKNKVSVRTP